MRFIFQYTFYYIIYINVNDSMLVLYDEMARVIIYNLISPINKG